MATRTRSPRVHTLPRNTEHPIETIMTETLTPVTKQPETPPQDAKAWAKDLCTRTFTLRDNQTNEWNTLTTEIISAPSPEFRTLYLAEVKARNERESAAEVLKTDDADQLAAAKKSLKSANTRVSMLATIARACNAGLDPATVVGQGQAAVYTAAKDLLAAQGAADNRGRRPDAMSVRFAKWFDKIDTSKLEESDKDAYAKIKALVSDLNPPTK